MTNSDNRLAQLGLDIDELFILHRNNASFLTGEAQTPEFRSTRADISRWLIIGMLPLAGTLIFISSAFSGTLPLEPATLDIAIAGLFSLVAILMLAIAFRLRQLHQCTIAALETAWLVTGQVISGAGEKTKISSKSNGSGQWYDVKLTCKYQSPHSAKTITIKAVNQRDESNRPGFAGTGHTSGCGRLH